MKLMKLGTLPLALVLFMSLLLVSACGGASEPEELELPISLRWGWEGNVELERMIPKRINVLQGDMVTLKIDTDNVGTLHFHGYDIKVDVSPEQVSEVYFVAEATGKFEVTFHGIVGYKDNTSEEAETHMGYVQVKPR